MPAILFSSPTKKESIEYCGQVCKKCDKQTGKMKYFTTQTKGKLDSCIPTQAPCPSDSISVAVWHTHGGYIPGIDNENFSPADKDYAKYWGQDIYLATPNDLFKQYVPPIGNKNEEEINRGKL